MEGMAMVPKCLHLSYTYGETTLSPVSLYIWLVKTLDIVAYGAFSMYDVNKMQNITPKILFSQSSLLFFTQQILYHGQYCQEKTGKNEVILKFW